VKEEEEEEEEEGRDAVSDAVQKCVFFSCVIISRQLIQSNFIKEKISCQRKRHLEISSTVTVELSRAIRDIIMG
jgi:hypothetical protein